MNSLHVKTQGYPLILLKLKVPSKIYEYNKFKFPNKNYEYNKFKDIL